MGLFARDLASLGHGRTVGRADGRADGRTDRWTGRLTGRQKDFSHKVKKPKIHGMEFLNKNYA